MIHRMSVSADNIALSAEQKQHIALLAEQTGRPWGDVLGEALATYRARTEATAGGNEESFFDAATRLGLIGCVKGGPPDLSTNPKYVGGLGEPGS
jgi:hypothetical protein